MIWTINQHIVNVRKDAWNLPHAAVDQLGKTCRASLKPHRGDRPLISSPLSRNSKHSVWSTSFLQGLLPETTSQINGRENLRTPQTNLIHTVAHLSNCVPVWHRGRVNLAKFQNGPHAPTTSFGNKKIGELKQEQLTSIAPFFNNSSTQSQVSDNAQTESGTAEHEGDPQK